MTSLYPFFSMTQPTQTETRHDLVLLPQLSLMT